MVRTDAASLSRPTGPYPAETPVAPCTGGTGNDTYGSCARLTRRTSLRAGHFPLEEVGALRNDDTDLRFHDRVQLDEIELYAEVLSAVAAVDRPLTPAELDEVLGLSSNASAEVSTSG